MFFSFPRRRSGCFRGSESGFESGFERALVTPDSAKPERQKEKDQKEKDQKWDRKVDQTEWDMADFSGVSGTVFSGQVFGMHGISEAEPMAEEGPGAGVGHAMLTEVQAATPTFKDMRTVARLKKDILSRVKQIRQRRLGERRGLPVDGGAPGAAGDGMASEQDGGGGGWIPEHDRRALRKRARCILDLEMGHQGIAMEEGSAGDTPQEAFPPPAHRESKRRLLQLTPSEYEDLAQSIEDALRHDLLLQGLRLAHGWHCTSLLFTTVALFVARVGTRGGVARGIRGYEGIRKRGARGTGRVHVRGISGCRSVPLGSLILAPGPCLGLGRALSTVSIIPTGCPCMVCAQRTRSYARSARPDGCS